MPYIPPPERKHLDPEIDALAAKITTPGQINYAVSRILWKNWKSSRSYLTACFLIGTIICVVLEFYRRVISPYEDEKIKENGDIF